MRAWQQDPGLAPVPTWFDEVLEVVLRDFQRPRPIEVLVGYEDRRGVVWFGEAGDASRAGFRITDHSEDEITAGLLVSLADWLQEQFFPETQAAWGQARPECPGHPHPAAAVELNDEAWWVCPADQRRISKVGAA